MRRVILALVLVLLLAPAAAAQIVSSPSGRSRSQILTSGTSFAVPGGVSVLTVTLCGAAVGVAAAGPRRVLPARAVVAAAAEPRACVSRSITPSRRERRVSPTRSA